MTSADPDRRDELRRPDPIRRLNRDLDRYGRRARDASHFWRSLGVLGSVGWPIALLGVGGALAGRWIDARRAAGTRWTLALLIAGIAAGAAIAWRLLKPEDR